MHEFKYSPIFKSNSTLGYDLLITFTRMVTLRFLFREEKNARKGRNVLSIDPKVSLATQRDSNTIVEVLALAK